MISSVTGPFDVSTAARCFRKIDFAYEAKSVYQVKRRAHLTRGLTELTLSKALLARSETGAKEFRLISPLDVYMSPPNMSKGSR